MELTKRIGLIEEFCVRCLQTIAAKRTQGHWERIGCLVYKLAPYTGGDRRMAEKLPHGINRFSCSVDRCNSEESGGAGDEELEANALFIELSSVVTEPGLRMTIASIYHIRAWHYGSDSLIVQELLKLYPMEIVGPPLGWKWDKTLEDWAGPSATK